MHAAAKPEPRGRRRNHWPAELSGVDLAGSGHAREGGEAAETGADLGWDGRA